MAHLHLCTLSILGSYLAFLASCQHLRSLQDILDLSPVEIDFGQPVHVFGAQHVVGSEEGLPDVAARLEGEGGVVDCNVDARVKCFVNVADPIRGEEQDAFVVLLQYVVSCMSYKR